MVPWEPSLSSSSEWKLSLDSWQRAVGGVCALGEGVVAGESLSLSRCLSSSFPVSPWRGEEEEKSSSTFNRPPPQAPPPSWRSSCRSATEETVRSGRPLLVGFHADLQLLTLTSRLLKGCWATDSCFSSSEDGARPHTLSDKEASDWSAAPPRVGVEQEVSERAGVGGAVMSSE